MTNFPQDQIDEVVRLFGTFQVYEESGRTFWLFPALPLREGCQPQACDVMFEPGRQEDHGTSKMFFAQPLATRSSQNQNPSVEHRLDRNWTKYSWSIKKPGLRLAELFAEHLGVTR